MKTISSDYIKKIKEQIRVINEALKIVQKAEEIQEKTVNINEYDKAKIEARNASLDVMKALEAAVISASNMGFCTGAYDFKRYHVVVEKSL